MARASIDAGVVAVVAAVVAAVGTCIVLKVKQAAEERACHL